MTTTEESTMTQYDDSATVCITHGRFVPCRTDDECVPSDSPSWVERVRHFQTSGAPWEPWTFVRKFEVTHDRAEIRDSDEPDEPRVNGDLLRALAEYAETATGTTVGALDLDAIRHLRGVGLTRREHVDALLAEVARVTREAEALRAQVAAVEDLHWEAEGKCAQCRDCYLDERLAWPCPTAAALATGEGQ